MSKGKFKSIVNQKVNKFAFKSLIETAKSQSKCQLMLRNINENDIKIQKYLISEKLVKEEQLLLFSLRSFTFPVKSNYRYLHENSMSCRACFDPLSEESEVHFSQSCEMFHKERDGEKLNFEDVFASIEFQIRFIKRFKIIARKWKLLLEMETSTI